ncbi:DNA gyrase subunit A [Candidatus Microthrix parvicella]|uniref:DNA gyrase subunit A n=1 Tax=Candidatus Neomicrothrix parvicella TaxID=41950 RepID=UPI00035C8C84|nr:DNA gyrase subunit A [Candidatus Microthrix parvicella]
MSDEPPIQPENDEPASEDGVPEDLVVPVELVDFSGEGIEPIEIQAEMEQSFLDYAMSVIVSRALPDVRDGLKPVHRRILWAMHEAGLRPDRQHRKCATVVGDVIGKYHPHGDSSVYDALVRMGQDFSLSHVLIDKHGNFGSLSDGPAAYRYTECRLDPLAMSMLAEIDEDTVDRIPNYDGSTEEPTVLPSRFPNLLVNGSQGIAVGMATNIPPHNLGEVIDAVDLLIDHPDATVDELMERVLGPDFPTGGEILGRAGLISAYRTGRGSIKLRGKAEIVEDANGRNSIVVSEVPYQTAPEVIEERAAELVNNRELEGIRAITNSSAKGQIKLVFELKRDASPMVVLNNLYKYTPLQTTFAANMVALVDGVPRTLNLRDALVHYLEHQREVVRRRTEFRLARAQRRAHIVEGLVRALDLIDAIIAAIRASADRGVARAALMGEGFEFSEIQANHILDLPLGRLTRLGRTELNEELAELRRIMAELEAILADQGRLDAVIREELADIRSRFAVDRRSAMTHDPGDLDVEDLIDDEDVVVVMTSRGYIKTTSLDAFRTQGRGGRGVAGAKLRDEDMITTLIKTSAHAYLLFFTNRGKVYRLKVHRIPMMDRGAQGTAIVNLLRLASDERVEAVIDTRDYESHRYLMFTTSHGVVKKTRFTAYDSSRQDGLIAVSLRDGDELVEVLPVNDDDEVMLVSSSGMGIRFAESDVRPMGRNAAGVRGMRLKSGDRVIGSAVITPDTRLLTVTDGGYGKRTDPDEFTRQGRGGQGVRAHRIRDDRGRVVAANLVAEDSEIFLITDAGVIIRTPVGSISEYGRDAMGVTVMRLDGDTKVVAVAPVVSEDGAVAESDEADVEAIVEVQPGE